MGRSRGYCFKIIACGSNSESVDRDELDASAENKGSDKRGWSFRKRSSSHRVLSNTVITEISSTVNKSSEPAIINSEPPVSSSVSEKVSANQLTEEVPHVSASTSEDRTESHLDIEAAHEDEVKLASTPDESIVIFIQAAVRKFLAQRELARLKRVVKLQAAIRGHLVRCRAAGTLRCIQAIIKMQALVRARHDSVTVEKTSTEKEGVLVSKTKPHPTYISIEKLLSNRFAIQLMESTPRTKQINVKCSPSSNNDLAWKWLERWTVVSSPQPDKPTDTENQTETIISEQKPDSHSDKSKHSNTRPESVPTTFPEKPLTDTELPKRPAKRVATEQADSEGRKSVFGSRKASNPAFIAAHSRFEELTSKNNSLTSFTLGYESLKVGQSPTVGSECGTELSVTSMLDSPDPSEAGVPGYEKEAKEVSDIKNTELTLTHSVLDSDSQVKRPQSHEDDSSNADIELEPVTGRQVYKSPTHKSSPEASPASHITAPEHDSSKTKTDRKTSSHKSKSNSKKSLVSSGIRTSLEHLPRERKPGKRRNSFGSQSSDQEPRDSSCSNSIIPSYMQVTESARAKSLANNSPKSSPDVQSKEAYMKRRHSGSGNGRHGSPSVKRTSPQAQQTSKGSNNTERKWQR